MRLPKEMICSKTQDDYPTEEALKLIENWDWLKEHNILEFLDFIQSIWKWQDSLFKGIK